MANPKIPPLPPAAKKMFQDSLAAQKKRIANGTESAKPTDTGGNYKIPVHNSGAGRSNFPTFRSADV